MGGTFFHLRHDYQTNNGTTLSLKALMLTSLSLKSKAIQKKKHAHHFALKPNRAAVYMGY